MIFRLLEVCQYMAEALHELDWDNLTYSEWKVFKNYHNLLEPFTNIQLRQVLKHTQQSLLLACVQLQGR